MTIWESLTTREQSYVNVIAQEMAGDVFGVRWSQLSMSQRDALTLAVARVFRSGWLDRKLMTFGPTSTAAAADALDGYRSAREQSIKDEQRVDFAKLRTDLLKAIEACNAMYMAVRNASQA